jgi:hypothetical protein
MGTRVSEEHAAPFFRVEVIMVRLWFLFTPPIDPDRTVFSPGWK